MNAFVRTGPAFLLLLVFAACSNNVLTYRHRPHFRERSIITSDSTFKLYQGVDYNVHHVMDEEFMYYLDLEFLDTAAAARMRIIDLEKDTAIVRARYGISSVWNWENENNRVSGTIEVLAMSRDEVTLKERVSVNDIRREEQVRFNGKRTFRRQEGW